jgi:hypothetical protein
LLKNTLEIVEDSETTTEYYEEAVKMLQPDYNHQDEFLDWVCRDNKDFLNLNEDRLEIDSI